MGLWGKTVHMNIMEEETNAIYYLLRKFNLLQETINIIDNINVTGKYGTYLWNGNNTISITDCEPTSNYKLIFSILNTATKQIRTVEADSNVSSSNTASIIIPALASNEILQTTVKVEITYPQHIQVNPYQITVTADKPIIQADETATLTAQLKYNGSAVSGKTLTYKILHGNTVIDSGSDTTDSQGKITFEYEGTAIGQVDLVVSYGMLLQETFVVYDVNFYDSGLNDGTANDNWNFNSNNLQVDRTSTGTLLTHINGTEQAYQADLLHDAQLFDFDTPFAMEFDLVEMTGTIMVYVASSTENGSVSMSYAGFTSGNTCKITYNDGVMKFYKNGVSSRADREFTLTGKVRLGFGIRASSSIKYKDFKVYPL